MDLNSGGPKNPVCKIPWGCDDCYHKFYGRKRLTHHRQTHQKTTVEVLGPTHKLLEKCHDQKTKNSKLVLPFQKPWVLIWKNTVIWNQYEYKTVACLLSFTHCSLISSLPLREYARSFLRMLLAKECFDFIEPHQMSALSKSKAWKLQEPTKTITVWRDYFLNPGSQFTYHFVWSHTDGNDV